MKKFPLLIQTLAGAATVGFASLAPLPIVTAAPASPKAPLRARQAPSSAAAEPATTASIPARAGSLDDAGFFKRLELSPEEEKVLATHHEVWLKAQPDEFVPGKARVKPGRGPQAARHTDEVVFLLHGICKSGVDMIMMQRMLERAGYATVNWSYPSRSTPIEEIAARLAADVARLASGRRVHFVGHSMGGLVIRTYLNQFRKEGGAAGAVASATAAEANSDAGAASATAARGRMAVAPAPDLSAMALGTAAALMPSFRARLGKGLARRQQELAAAAAAGSSGAHSAAAGATAMRDGISASPPPRLGKVVMIGTPNQGALLADMFGDWMAFKLIFGPAGQQLRQGERGAAAAVGAPPCDFGVIAGGTGGRGFNPIIPADNDGTVSVESTHLAGERDFLLLPYVHPIIQMMPRTGDAVVNFLRTGQFTP